MKSGDRVMIELHNGRVRTGTVLRRLRKDYKGHRWYLVGWDGSSGGSQASDAVLRPADPANVSPAARAWHEVTHG